MGLKFYWLKPRYAMQKVGSSSSKLLPFVLLALVCLLWFTPAMYFIFDTIGLPPFISTKAKLLEQMFWFYILICSSFLVVIQLFTFPIKFISSSLGGKADLPKTRLALLWPILCLSPVWFFISVLDYAMKNPDISYHFLLNSIAVWGGVGVIIYALVVAGKTLAEVNGFSLLKAWLSLIVGGGFFAAIAYAIVRIIYLIY